VKVRRHGLKTRDTRSIACGLGACAMSRVPGRGALPQFLNRNFENIAVPSTRQPSSRSQRAVT
jgi:hypothetical protein